MSRSTVDVKRIALAVLLLLAVAGFAAGAVVANTEPSEALNKGRGVGELPLEGRYAISAAMGRELKAYHIEAKGDDLRSTNTAQSLTARFSLEGVEVGTGEGLLRLTLSAWGYGERLRVVEPARPQAVENRVEYRRGLLTEWYVNGPFGLQQGFTVEAAPPGGDGERPLRLSLALGGGLRAGLDQDRRGLVLHRGDGTAVLQYRGLTVTDAGGRQARSWLEVKGDVLLVNVDDKGMRYPLKIDPFIQTAKLTASDGAAGDQLGGSVAESGDVVVVGAPDANSGQGSAYVFVKPGAGWATTSAYTAKLTASDGAANDWFGYSVAVSGDVVVVTALGANSLQGSAYVFVKPGAGWATTSAYTAKLTASDGAANDQFGHSVAVSGDVVVVGAPYDDISANTDQGAAYVFVKPEAGWATTSAYTAKLTASDGAANDWFAWSVAVSGDVVVVGAPENDITAYNNEGSAYVFVKPEAGWATTSAYTAKLTASDRAAGDSFGWSVAVSGDVVVVGAIGANNLQGAAYVFVKPEASWATTSAFSAKLTASDGAANDRFGRSVAVSGDVVVVGAIYDDIGANTDQGSAYVFVKPGAGWATTSAYTAKLTASDGAASDGFGISVAVSGDVVVGASGANNYQGSAYVYLPSPGMFYVIPNRRGGGAVVYLE
jgi:glyoxylate utilization-related uncharacterized protein